jgi:hypothetical protein
MYTECRWTRVLLCSLCFIYQVILLQNVLIIHSKTTTSKTMVCFLQLCCEKQQVKCFQVLCAAHVTVMNAYSVVQDLHK